MMLLSFFLHAFVLVAQVPGATQVVSEDIPGIVKAGTKIELVKSGLDGADDPSVCRTAQPFSLNRRRTGFGKLIRPAGFPCFARTPTEGSVCRSIRKAASFRSNPRTVIPVSQ